MKTAKRNLYIGKLFRIVSSVMLPLALGGAFHRVQAQLPTFSNPLEIDNTYHPFVELRLRVYEVQERMRRV